MMTKFHDKNLAILTGLNHPPTISSHIQPNLYPIIEAYLRHWFNIDNIATLRTHNLFPILPLAVQREDHATVFLIFTLFNCWVDDRIMEASLRDKLLLQHTTCIGSDDLLVAITRQQAFGRAGILLDQFERIVDVVKRDESIASILECALQLAQQRICWELLHCPTLSSRRGRSS